MKLPVDWLREFVDPNAGVADIASRLAACGFAIDAVDGDVIDLEVTANRPDALSVYGLAREVATAFDRPLAPLDAPRFTEPAGARIPVTIEHDDCRRYVLALADVIVGTSPAWLADRLTAAGVRPINTIVDITNYVMLETGQPLHAFDAATLAGPAIHVRRARAGERLTSLDGVDRALDPTMLVIADREAPAAIAGVMGGRATEVSAGTTRAAIESAWFLPASVRATSKRLGLKTEASMRFERGADIEAPAHAIRRVMALLERLKAGRPAAPLVDVYPHPRAPLVVLLDRASLTRLLGMDIPDAEVVRILTRLGFVPEPSAEGWRVSVPSFRVDVTREADLIEEVGRHWGFDRVPATLPPLRTPPPEPSPRVTMGRHVRRLLAGAGLQEAQTFAFLEAAAAEPFAPDGRTVAIANPLSEKFATLRPSLLPGLLDALVYNRRRDADRVRLFEVGAVFLPEGETTRVGWVMAGPRGDHWSDRIVPVDVFDGLGVADLIAQSFGRTLQAKPADDLPWFVRGRSARLLAGSAAAVFTVGGVGEIRPDLVSARGLDGVIVMAGEVDLLRLGVDRERMMPFRPVPRMPSVVRDLSLVVVNTLPAAELRGTIRAHAPDTLVSIREFDRYQGPGVPDGHLGLSVRLTFRDTARTLTDGEVQQAVDGIVTALGREHGARLRGAAGETPAG